MSRPILTAAAMRAAEQAAIDAGTGSEALVERAGAALARAVRRFVGPRETLLLCGPGNNGADGRVAARHLADAGYTVRDRHAGRPRERRAGAVADRLPVRNRPQPRAG